jgi:hypothetical protein
MRLTARLVPEEAAVDITHRNGTPLTSVERGMILTILLLDGVSARLTVDAVRILELGQVEDAETSLGLVEPMDISDPWPNLGDTEVSGR